MAEVKDLNINVRLIPDDETMELVLKLLDVWQDANPDKFIALVPQKDKYGYEIITRERKAK